MSSDRVPGVKTLAGAPVTQTLTPEAERAASKLEAAVRRQLQAKQKRARDDLAESAPSPFRVSHGEGGLLSQIRSVLDARIDGQEAAKSTVARAVRRRVLGLSDAERPLRLLFSGPSGVGKTAMATSCCEAVLGSCLPDRNFKRFNLSEFSHPSKFNRLTGGDPNYVGYKEGGELTNFIRQAEERRAKKLGGKATAHTSCVILFDEVDRAADGLLTFLMNFLDQGELADGRGDTVDARRALIIMTTNVGRAAITSNRDPPGSNAELVARIRQEVLRDICDGRWENLGRLGTIVPFTPLSDEGRKMVVERQLAQVAERLESSQRGAIGLEWSDALVEYVLSHWDADIGGRSTRDFTEESVVEAIADVLDADVITAAVSAATDSAGAGAESASPRKIVLDAVREGSAASHITACFS